MANLAQQQLDMLIAILIQNAGGGGAVGTGVSPEHNTVPVAPTGNPVAGNPVAGLWNMGPPGINMGLSGGISSGAMPGMPNMGLQEQGMMPGMTGYGIPGRMNFGIPPGTPPQPPPPVMRILEVQHEGPGTDAGYVAKALWKLGPTDPAQIAQIMGQLNLFLTNPDLGHSERLTMLGSQSSICDISA
jgi:hypothetical protein